ncbi:MAG TPA: hypothetical protein VHE55_10130 [Fimbriimonadaceae bacterium]|nr:hypothetical protein [Fimbriimonadaceae bacterium]
MNFQRWMQEVDDICMHTYSLSIHDLPDMPFYDAYKSGQTPEEFIGEAIPNVDALRAIVFS